MDSVQQTRNSPACVKYSLQSRPIMQEEVLFHIHLKKCCDGTSVLNEEDDGNSTSCLCCSFIASSSFTFSTGILLSRPPAICFMYGNPILVTGSYQTGSKRREPNHNGLLLQSRRCLTHAVLIEPRVQLGPTSSPSVLAGD